MKAAERWSEHTKQLPPLIVGNTVRIQNQTGQFPKKWDKTGRVVEVRQFNQYVVRVDGSGRVTLRNRKFLRKYTPVHPTPTPINDVLNLIPQARTTPSPPVTTSNGTKKQSVQDTDSMSIPPASYIPSTAPTLPSAPAASTEPQGQLPPCSDENISTPQHTEPSTPKMLTRLQTYNTPGLCEQPISHPNETNSPASTLRRSERLKNQATP